MDFTDLKIDPNEILKNNRWCTKKEIDALLEGYQYIIMGEPANQDATHIFFTLFLNTDENLPKEIIEPIVQKQAELSNITDVAEISGELSVVGFSDVGRDTELPIDISHMGTKEINEIEHVNLFIIQFEGNSNNFAKVYEGFSGWSYVPDEA
jgi:hypothetical protein